MKVQELIGKATKEGKISSSVAKKLVKFEYMPVMDKKKFVLDVIAACTDEIDNFISVDRFKMNIYFDMSMLGAYTNLEVTYDFDDMVAQYDMLCEHGLLEHLVKLFESEYVAMHKILDDVLDELLVQNSIDMQVVKIANKISALIDNIGEALDGLDLGALLPEGTNISEIINMLK